MSNENKQQLPITVHRLIDKYSMRILTSTKCIAFKPIDFLDLIVDVLELTPEQRNEFLKDLYAERASYEILNEEDERFRKVVANIIKNG